MYSDSMYKTWSGDSVGADVDNKTAPPNPPSKNKPIPGNKPEIPYQFPGEISPDIPEEFPMH